MNTVRIGAFSLALTLMLASVDSAAAPRIIYFNGSLAITSFDVQMPAGTGWMDAPTLVKDRKYRFAFRVFNNAGNPRNFDITNLKLLDMLKPWPQIARGDEIVYTGVHLIVGPPATGFGSYVFYQDESFSGPALPIYSSSPDFERTIEREKGTDLYVYFVWKGPTTALAMPLPPNYMPQVSMRAKELRVKWQPAGPTANLQPNT